MVDAAAPPAGDKKTPSDFLKQVRVPFDVVCFRFLGVKRRMQLARQLRGFGFALG